MTRAKQQAQICADAMDAAGFSPATIINVGVGSSPEHIVWVRRFPKAVRVGIDPRGRHSWGKDPFINAAAMDFEAPSVVWCGCCRSILCPDPYGHPNKVRRHISKVVTLDGVAANYPAPYFLWLDCEGSELAALRGGQKMIENTRFVSVEWTNNQQDIDHWLCERGFSVVSAREHDLLDRLYARTA